MLSTTTIATPVVHLAESAAQELKGLLTGEPAGRQLPVFVEQGGCSGMRLRQVL